MPKLARIACIACIACIAAACGRQPPPSGGASATSAPAPAPSAAAAPAASADTTSPPPPPELCDPSECGPRLGLANRQCADGSIAGPTGRCLRHASGQCGWEIRQCPP